MIGDSMSLHCATDGTGRELTHFVARTIQTRIPPHAIERMCQEGTLVSAQWKIGLPNSPFPSDVTSLNSFLDEIDESLHHKAIEKKKRVKRRDLVETWDNILYLDRQLKEENLNRLKYSSWASWTLDKINE